MYMFPGKFSEVSASATSNNLCKRPLSNNTKLTHEETEVLCWVMSVFAAIDETRVKKQQKETGKDREKYETEKQI